jgi:hypothetical protein
MGQNRKKKRGREEKGLPNLKKDQTNKIQIQIRISTNKLNAPA